MVEPVKVPPAQRSRWGEYLRWVAGLPTHYWLIISVEGVMGGLFIPSLVGFTMEEPRFWGMFCLFYPLILGLVLTFDSWRRN